MTKKKILIIDDSKTFHSFIKGVLGEYFDLVHSLDPTLAKDMALEFHPDLVLVDLEMPHLRGTDVCKLFSADKKLNSIPIIILTANFSDDLFLEAVE